MSIREELQETLPADIEYRHAYADEILNLMVCTQLRMIREQQHKTQDEIAKALGTTQTAVSRLENVNYSAWNIRTLKKMARAFDLRLRITFEGFGTLWKDVQSLNRQSLERPTIQEDPEFNALCIPSSQNLAHVLPDMPEDEKHPSQVQEPKEFGSNILQFPRNAQQRGGQKETTEIGSVFAAMEQA